MKCNTTHGKAYDYNLLYSYLQTISSEEEMCDHVRECHADLQFICGICGQSLRTNAAFQRHMDIHKGLRGSACEVIAYLYTSVYEC